jgi:alpha-D-xyloside xylohydrolase
MDFRADPKARNIADQYMFGPALLVNPVTEYKARTRQVYLPAGSRWYDFWTGQPYEGGQSITAEAPYDRIPLFVRSGSIVPVGPEQQYIGARGRETLTLYVYTGGNARFSLYEDDGRTYGYERNQLSRVPLSWNDATSTLTIGQHEHLPSSTRVFNVVLVSPTARQGYAGATAAGKIVKYSGQEVRVTF